MSEGGLIPLVKAAYDRAERAPWPQMPEGTLFDATARAQFFAVLDRAVASIAGLTEPNQAEAAISPGEGAG